LNVYIELYVNLTLFSNSNLIFFFFRTTESLFEELVEQELLKKADNVKLKDYLGNVSVYGKKKRKKKK